MSQTAEPENVDRDRYDAIIPHATEPRVLLLPGEDGWRLPQWEPGEGQKSSSEYWSRVSLVNQAMAEQLGLRVTTRRCLYPELDTETGPKTRVFVHWMENHSPALVPPAGARWLTRGEVEGLALAIPEQRGLLEAWFADAGGGPPPALRSPWAHPGWFDTAVAWVEAQMKRLGLTPTGPVEQVRSLTISCVLRVKTTSGDLYMKAAPELFAAEAAVTQALADRYPWNVPTLLATDPEHNWMLMRDMAGGPLRKCPRIAGWEGVVRVYAWMQREFVERGESLTALGCRDRRLDRLAAGIEPLLDDVTTQDEHLEGLSAAELERLHGLVPRLRAMCAELAEYRVPATLEHGDLHAGNVAVTDASCILYDWSDACLSHPFFSMVTLLGHTAGIADCPDAGARLRDLYLEAWTEFERRDRLRQAYEISQILGRLHQAQSYHWITSHLEESARWEWSGGSADWLRGLLKRLDAPR